MKVDVVITGITPLLMHNPLSMMGKRSDRKVIPTPEGEAERSAYWSSNGARQLILTADHVRGCILNGAKGYRIGKTSLVPVLAGSLDVEPEEISLGTDKYEIDIRTVVVQKQRVPRARAKIMPWSAKFTIITDDDELTRQWVEGSLPELLRRSGKIVGLLDYRPSHKGRFGKFELESFEVVEGKVR